MSRASELLDELDELLFALPDEGEDEPMILSQLDGYLACLLVMPSRIAEEVWLPCVWPTQPSLPRRA